jgi:ribonucleoside-diphosphate reductase alpha chain
MIPMKAARWPVPSPPIMTGHAYEQSAEIAANMGAFKGYRDARCAGWKNRRQGQRGIHARRHQTASRRRGTNPAEPEFNYLKDEARNLGRALAKGKQFGYRNAQVTVLAPTGTIAFLMDCDTTGVEPDIALVKYKLLAGGGMLKIVNRGVPDALRRLGYSEATSPDHRAHRENSTRSRMSRKMARRFISSGLKAEHLPVFDCAFKAASRQAQHRLPGASEDDGRRAAVHQRRHFQDRQHAE